jgi:hypothetical protein
LYLVREMKPIERIGGGSSVTNISPSKKNASTSHVCSKRA